MAHQRKYDLYFSLGEACSCRQMLSKFNLQDHSYPFDWLYGSSFIERCKILSTDFKDYINKEDLVSLNLTNKDPKHLCEIYHNNRNNLTFNHDFAYEKSLDETYDAVKQKYDRRIDRLIRNIEQANSVLIVYIEIPLTNYPLQISSGQILQGYQFISDRYKNKKIDLLYLKNSSQKTDIYLSENVRYVTLDYKEHHETLDYLVRIKPIKSILRYYKNNKGLMFNFKRAIITLLAKNFPSRKIRDGIRIKYHVK